MSPSRSLRRSPRPPSLSVAGTSPLSVSRSVRPAKRCPAQPAALPPLAVPSPLPPHRTPLAQLAQQLSVHHRLPFKRWGDNARWQPPQQMLRFLPLAHGSRQLGERLYSAASVSARASSRGYRRLRLQTTPRRMADKTACARRQVAAAGTTLQRTSSSVSSMAA